VRTFHWFEETERGDLDKQMKIDER